MVTAITFPANKHNCAAFFR